MTICSYIMIYISRVPGLGLGLIHFGLGLEKLLWPRPHSLWPRPWPRAKLASLTSLIIIIIQGSVKGCAPSAAIVCKVFILKYCVLVDRVFRGTTKNSCRYTTDAEADEISAFEYRYPFSRSNSKCVFLLRLFQN